MAEHMLQASTVQPAAHYIQAENLTGMGGTQLKNKVGLAILAEALEEKHTALENAKLG
jgi:hypothetical protein